MENNPNMFTVNNLILKTKINLKFEKKMNAYHLIIPYNCTIQHMTLNNYLPFLYWYLKYL